VKHLSTLCWLTLTASVLMLYLNGRYAILGGGMFWLAILGLVFCGIMRWANDGFED